MRLAPLAGLALLILACRTPGLPELRPIYGDEARIDGWLGDARADAEQRLAVRALGKLRLRGPRGSSRVKQVIIAERPGNLRLESLNFLGQTVSLLVTDGAQYAFYDGQAIERGSVFQDLLRDTVGLDLAPAEAVALLVAAPNLPSGQPRAIFALGDDRVAWFELSRVRFAMDGSVRTVEKLDPAGRVRWLAEYRGWRPAQGGRYPHQMVFSFPASELRAELDFDQVELNPSLDAALFSLLPEEGE